MPFRGHEIEAILQDKFGFVRAEGHNSDHRWYELRLPGLPTILTKVSHGRHEVSAKVEGQMARQLRVRGPYFQGMLSCTHERDAYYQRVRDDPFPPFSVRL
jgi:hypothetical protein